MQNSFIILMILGVYCSWLLIESIVHHFITSHQNIFIMIFVSLLYSI